ncbi:DUF1129 domain-containing protein [Alkalicoccobacillus murimartini]|uniref:DNA-binding ferritin-like protein (Dps family) n=1 Tax=Alkalicoccobacillus murimartini TaxID=171685 RepID=A0ABT9YJH6_9BACI|nr:hypothetical protein [Alkalicoccobacillus murimartini]MDQ0208012.1 DNA-binding ferritin-like protein (Dps family) [Alkalicoccobacillus murimartini]
MGKNSYENQSDDRRLLHMQDQVVFNELKDYLHTKEIPKSIADQLLHSFQKQLVTAREENKDIQDIIGEGIDTYCDREIDLVTNVAWRSILLSMVGTGFFILCAFFLLQAIVHFISFMSYGNSGATLTHVSLMPMLIFAVLGYGGLAILAYVHTNRYNVKRPLLWKISGWVSLLIGTGLCMASMSMWDEVLMIPLNTSTSLVIAVVCFVMYKWMKSPLKKVQRNRTVENN